MTQPPDPAYTIGQVVMYTYDENFYIGRINFIAFASVVGSDNIWKYRFESDDKECLPVKEQDIIKVIGEEKKEECKLHGDYEGDYCKECVSECMRCEPCIVRMQRGEGLCVMHRKEPIHYRCGVDCLETNCELFEKNQKNEKEAFIIQRLRDIAEIYIGMDGYGGAVTAQEAYYQCKLKEMYDETQEVIKVITKD